MRPACVLPSCSKVDGLRKFIPAPVRHHLNLTHMMSLHHRKSRNQTFSVQRDVFRAPGYERTLPESVHAVPEDAVRSVSKHGGRRCSIPTHHIFCITSAGTPHRTCASGNVSSSQLPYALMTAGTRWKSETVYPSACSFICFLSLMYWGWKHSTLSAFPLFVPSSEIR